MSKDKPASNVRVRSQRGGRPARPWPERIDADPEEVMRVLMRTPREGVIMDESVNYRAEGADTPCTRNDAE